jgi:hypothetical protein
MSEHDLKQKIIDIQNQVTNLEIEKYNLETKLRDSQHETHEMAKMYYDEVAIVNSLKVTLKTLQHEFIMAKKRADRHVEIINGLIKDRSNDIAKIYKFKKPETTPDETA